MKDASDRPLWRVLHDAAVVVSRKTGPIFSRRMAAAQLRALALEVLPEQPEPEPGRRYEQRHIIWQRDNQIRALLLAEAERAELEW